MKILITGGCGFLGSNLASYGLSAGNSVVVFDNLSRVGSEQNLLWLKSLGGDFRFIKGDTSNKNDVDKVISSSNFDSIFHVAGQVAMTTSIVNPRLDFETNAFGAFNVLDAVRRLSPKTTIIFSSTNKVYGDLEYLRYSETKTRYVCPEFPNGFDESTPLDFRSPYGCSKGTADQYMLDFHRIYGLKTIVFRHSSMYGSRQYATYDQGWIGWFVSKALERKKNPNCESFTISGNGKQVRDILHADDMISLYYLAAEKSDIAQGQVFNIGGGFDQSLSLLELFDILEKKLGISLRYKVLPPRQSDQKVFIADIAKAKRILGWTPKVSADEGINRMLSWVNKL